MNWEIALYWAGATFYAIGSVLALTGLIFKKESLTGYALWVGAAGLIPHGVSILIRWKIVGHGPYINMYEIMSANAWVAMTFYLLLQIRYRFLKKAGFIVLPVVFLAMGFGLMGTTEAVPLPPSLRSYWLVLHVIFAYLCTSSFLLASGSAGLYIYKRKRPESRFSGKLPLPERLDVFVYRFNALGFGFLSIMIIAGSIWANNAWGRYWGWDPVETWSLITWLAYGMFLHLRLNRNWTGLRSAYFTLFLFICSILSLFIIPNFLKSVHSQYMVR